MSRKINEKLIIPNFEVIHYEAENMRVAYEVKEGPNGSVLGRASRSSDWKNIEGLEYENDKIISKEGNIKLITEYFQPTRVETLGNHKAAFEDYLKQNGVELRDSFFNDSKAIYDKIADGLRISDPYASGGNGRATNVETQNHIFFAYGQSGLDVRERAALNFTKDEKGYEVAIKDIDTVRSARLELMGNVEMDRLDGYSHGTAAQLSGPTAKQFFFGDKSILGIENIIPFIVDAIGNAFIKYKVDVEGKFINFKRLPKYFEVMGGKYYPAKGEFYDKNGKLTELKLAPVESISSFERFKNSIKDAFKTSGFLNASKNFWSWFSKETRNDRDAIREGRVQEGSALVQYNIDAIIGWAKGLDDPDLLDYDDAAELGGVFKENPDGSSDRIDKDPDNTETAENEVEKNTEPEKDEAEKNTEPEKDEGEKNAEPEKEEVDKKPEDEEDEKENTEKEVEKEPNEDFEVEKPEDSKENENREKNEVEKNEDKDERSEERKDLDKRFEKNDEKRAEIIKDASKAEKEGNLNKEKIAELRDRFKENGKEWDKLSEEKALLDEKEDKLNDIERLEERNNELDAEIKDNAKKDPAGLVTGEKNTQNIKELTLNERLIEILKDDIEKIDNKIENIGVEPTFEKIETKPDNVEQKPETPKTEFQEKTEPKLENTKVSKNTERDFLKQYVKSLENVVSIIGSLEEKIETTPKEELGGEKHQKDLELLSKFKAEESDLKEKISDGYKLNFERVLENRPTLYKRFELLDKVPNATIEYGDKRVEFEIDNDKGERSVLILDKSLRVSKIELGTNELGERIEAVLEKPQSITKLDRNPDGSMVLSAKFFENHKISEIRNLDGPVEKKDSFIDSLLEIFSGSGGDQVEYKGVMDINETPDDLLDAYDAPEENELPDNDIPIGDDLPDVDIELPDDDGIDPALVELEPEYGIEPELPEVLDDPESGQDIDPDVIEAESPDLLDSTNDFDDIEEPDLFANDIDSNPNDDDYIDYNDFDDVE